MAKFINALILNVLIMYLGGNTQQGTNYTATCLPSGKLSKLDEPDMQDTAGRSQGFKGTCITFSFVYIYTYIYLKTVHIYI